MHQLILNVKRKRFIEEFTANHILLGIVAFRKFLPVTAFLRIPNKMLPSPRNNVICLANVHDVPSFRRVFPLLDILGMHDVNDRILLKILSGMLFHHRISRNGLLQLALDNGM